MKKWKNAYWQQKNDLKKDIRCIYISIIKQASMNGIL